jgi:hypothetical protein
MVRPRSGSIVKRYCRVLLLNSTVSATAKAEWLRAAPELAQIARQSGFAV